MDESIRALGEKIKGNLSQWLARDLVFYGLVGVLIFALGIGLGRLSVTLVPAGEMASAIQKIDARTSSQVVSPDTSVATSEPQQQPVAVATSGAYVGSKNSTKYHLPWCAGAKRIAEVNKVWFATKEEAQRAGYTPAGNCPGI